MSLSDIFKKMGLDPSFVDEGCRYIMVRGERKGKPCEGKISDGTKFCSKHKPKPEPSFDDMINGGIPCQWKLEKGVRIGLDCGGKSVSGEVYCKSHLDIVERRGEPSPSSASSGCVFLLTRGDRKGHPCDRPISSDNLCRDHVGKISTPAASTPVKEKRSRKQVPVALRNAVIEARGDRCYCCKRKLHFTEIEMGHIVSHDNGGDIDFENLRPVCGACNKSIGNVNMDEYKRINKIP
jgi:5-methylcytosine-specific restriction endonuclease McrA